jgi:hypothetical protein
MHIPPHLTVQRMISARISLTCLLVSGAMLVAEPARSQQPMKRERDVITREELLVAHSMVDLYQAIRGLRPQFLAPPPGARTRVVGTSVYVDGVRQTSLESLRTIPTAFVQRVQYLDPNRAESEFGHRAAGGAVMVTTTEGQTRVPAVVRDTTTPPPSLL